ncbi:peptidylprolyl isomerase [Flavobacterium sp.]|uniref:peptidylprolyl isomerase n=1 Tax=Flavobacterium sp. TaxID=239 RepID=UPI0039E58914
MKNRFLLLLLAIVTLASCKDEHSNLPDGLYANIETNKGNIIVALEFEKVPFTVANFVSLAEGKNNFVSEEFKGKPFFDDMKWHRVEKGFVIQGGDPLGNGSGDAGYRFRDEIAPGLSFDKDGILGMANSGPVTNSSQFFITQSATPWLDGKHTIFGHVVENGMDIVNQIDVNDDIISVTIIRKGEAAKKFDAAKVFSDFFTKEAENQKKQAAIDAENKRIYEAKYKAIKEQKVAEFGALKKEAQKSASGLQYKITTKGTGKKPAEGSQVFIHYAGFLENGELFDTSVAETAAAFGKFDQNRAAQHGYEPIPFMAGNKTGMIPGFVEGIEKMGIGDKATLFIPAHLAYGAQGAGGVIPPNANIIFEVELRDKP